jgi:hypothetical protein
MPWDWERGREKGIVGMENDSWGHTKGQGCKGKEENSEGRPGVMGGGGGLN